MSSSVHASGFDLNFSSRCLRIITKIGISGCIFHLTKNTLPGVFLFEDCATLLDGVSRTLDDLGLELLLRLEIDDERDRIEIFEEFKVRDTKRIEEERETERDRPDPELSTSLSVSESSLLRNSRLVGFVAKMECKASSPNLFKTRARDSYPCPYQRSGHCH